MKLDPPTVDLGYGIKEVPYWGRDHDPYEVAEYRSVDGARIFLTMRQLQCFAFAIQLGVQEAAHRLGISGQTVKNHLSQVYKKLGVMGRFEALVALGWVALPAELFTQEGPPLYASPEDAPVVGRDWNHMTR